MCVDYLLFDEALTLRVSGYVGQALGRHGLKPNPSFLVTSNLRDRTWYSPQKISNTGLSSTCKDILSDRILLWPGCSLYISSSRSSGLRANLAALLVVESHKILRLDFISFRVPRSMTFLAFFFHSLCRETHDSLAETVWHRLRVGRSWSTRFSVYLVSVVVRTSYARFRNWKNLKQLRKR